MELLVIIIILALIFDYINGFHDAANSIATHRINQSTDSFPSSIMGSIL